MKKINIRRHWEKFYKKNYYAKESNFARFVFKKIKKKKIIDIGCGNGRDTFFFFNKGLDTTGLDFSKTAIKNNNSKKKIFMFNNICKNNLKNLNKKFDYIYARFFLHAIKYKEEDIFLKNLKKISKKNSVFFLEFRTTSDKLMKKGKVICKYERLTDHYRRFINVIDFQKKLHSVGYKILFIKESTNFAKFKNDKPSICRVIFKR